MKNSSEKMASYLQNTEEITGANTVNRQLLENQTFLHHENENLQHDVTRLSRQLENLRKASVSPDLFETLKKEKDHLLALNDTLRKKIKHMKNPSTHLDKKDSQKETQEKLELIRTVQELDRLLEKIKKSEKFEVKPCENETAKVVEALTKKIDEEQRKNEEATEALRKLREDDEKYILREKLTDMKQLITDLEVENTKLRFESEQLAEDVENYKKQLSEATDEAKSATKKYYELEDEKDRLKSIISDLENEKIKLKKEMIEEMNEANRAKRVSVDTEIALHHISEAYENKRKENQALHAQLDDAEKIIRGFKNQFDPIY
ncbi:unnamed protein product [Phaedon cochleariae]|uniref:Uncharacterized protein n=1 Tax=Phaedon cochleariae TaxID=80249 RepID=A0A9P0DML9_PHACE|nr:unnamed protein product [Phaedon cochleariae]